MTNHCGTCVACCRVYSIPELDKKVGEWCQHCDVGVGCKIYEARPTVCRTYECMWLLSQHREDVRERMAAELRPDRCKVVIGAATDPSIITFDALPGYYDAWRKVPGIARIIKNMARMGMRAVMNTSVLTRKIVVDRDGEREIEMTEPDEQGTQWYVATKEKSA